MFSLTNHPAKVLKVASFKGTKEKAGGLKTRLLVSVSAETLDTFAPGLYASFFRAADLMSAQTKDAAPVPRYAALKSVPWSAAIIGAEVMLARRDLFDQADPVRFTESDVDRFQFEPRDDGLVDILLDVKSRPDEMDAGRMYGWVESVVLVTLTPPAMATYAPSDAHEDDRQGELDDGADRDPDGLDGDDHDGPRTSDDLPASAVAADGAEPAGNGVKVSKRRRRRAFPDAKDGRPGADPFPATAERAPARVFTEAEWPFPGSVPADSTPPAGTVQ